METCETCKWWRGLCGEPDIMGKVHGDCTNMKAIVDGGVTTPTSDFGCINHKKKDDADG